MPSAAAVAGDDDEVKLVPRSLSHPSLNPRQDRKRKAKSSSSKRRRRRRSRSRSSSPSDHSRRKSSKRRRRSPSQGKRRKGSKKSSKKKTRKPRSRRDLSSDSSSSCSTCRGRSSSPDDAVSVRSRSPKPKARGRSRRTRYRSPSCSSCSPVKVKPVERGVSDDERCKIRSKRAEEVEDVSRQRLSDDDDRGRIRVRLESAPRELNANVWRDSLNIRGGDDDDRGKSRDDDDRGKSRDDDDRGRIQRARLESAPRELNANVWRDSLNIQGGEDDDRGRIQRARLESAPRELNANVWRDSLIIRGGEDDDRGKIRSKRSNDDVYMTERRIEKQARVEEDADLREDEGDRNRKGWVRSSKVNGGSRDKSGLIEDQPARISSVVVASSLPLKSVGNDHRGLESGLSRDRFDSSTVENAAGTGSIEAEDLEVILRQKALENFRKFRGGISASTCSVGDRKGKAISGESQKDGRMKDLVNASSVDDPRYPINVRNKSVSDSVASGSQCNVTSKLAADWKISSSSNTPKTENPAKNAHTFSDKMSSEQSLLPVQSLETPSPAHGRDQPVKVGAKSVSVPVDGGSDNKITTKLADDHTISSSSNNRNTKDLVMSEQQYSSHIFSEETSSPKDIEGKKTAEANIADRSSLGTSCPITVNGNCKPSEPAGAATSADQFQQKTFTRTRDGEVVQVSYKVYIPKKSSTSARRPLQR